MRFTSDTQRRGWAAAIAGATLLTGGHAMALGCLDIPGAKIDPALNASAANQSYGRLFPEFKSRQKTIEAKRALPIDRLVGKRLQVDGGTGHVWLALTPDGSTEITAVAGDRVATHTTPSRLAGLDNAAYNGKLARTFFSLGIAWRDFAAPRVPVIDFAEVPAITTIAKVSQTTLQLKGTPRVEHEQTTEYACSDKATFVGDPSQLSSIVVLKGTIRARQLTTTITTETVLDLTINDVVEQQTASYEEVAVLLGDYPKIAAVLKQMLETEPAEVAVTSPAEQSEQKAAAGQTEQTGVAETTAAAAVPAAQVVEPAPEPPSPPPQSGPSWTAFLSILAGLCAVILLLLYHPRFTARRQRDNVSADAGSTPPFETVPAVSEGETAVSRPDSKLAGAATDVEPKPEAVAAGVQPAPEPKDATVVSDPEPKSVAPVAEPEPEASKMEPEPEVETAPQAAKLNIAAAVATLQPQVSSEPVDTGKSLEARIAVLETLRVETESFQEKLKDAIVIAASEAEGGREAKERLAEVEGQLEELAAAKTKLQEAAQDDRAKLNAVQDEARLLKEMVVSLKTRLAKANAQIESSVSVISELESASKMAIELNADYRTKTHDSSAENRALRSRIGLLENALAERDDLLQSTNQTNEEISRALLEERTERASVEEDFNALSKDLETLQQTSSTDVKRASMEATQAVQELEASRELIASLEGELERAYGEQKQMQLDHHAKQTENARLRVEHGVRTRLLENNLQELSSHVESLEQRLRDSGMDVPSLQLTPIDLPGLDEELPPKPEPAAASNPGHTRKRGDILRFRTKR